MRVGEADAFCIESAGLDHMTDVSEIGHLRLRHQIELCQGSWPVMKRAKRQLSGETGMHYNLIVREQRLQLGVARPKIVDPDVRIGEDHRSSTRSRRTYSRSGIVPPSCAS